MKLPSLIAILSLFFIAGCAVVPTAPDDVPNEAVHLANVTILTPGLETARRAIVFYPPELYDTGVSGRVKISLEINKAGEVTLAQVVESTERRFEIPSIKGALKWSFKPGPRKGEILLDFISPNPKRDTTTEPPVVNNEPGPFEGDYIPVKDAEVKPKLIVSATPKYPYNASKQNLNGFVDVAYIINTAGEPTQIRILKATTADFAASVVAAVEKWRFSPAIKHGKPVACLAQQRLDFALDQ